MTKHKLSTYGIEHNKISFCRICSAEGQQLLENCPGEVPILKAKSPSQKDLDNMRDWLDSVNYANYN